MLILEVLIDTLKYIPVEDLAKYINTLKTPDTQTSFNLTNVLLSVIAFLGTFVGGIWAYIKLKETNKQDLAIRKNSINQLEVEADIQNDMKFQEKIVYKFFEEYVKQNTWITDQFASKFEVLLDNLQSQNKLMKDIYAQIDTFRRELRSYDKSTSNDLKKLEGILSRKDVNTK